MKRYYIDNRGHRRKVTKDNIEDYLRVKDKQWFRIWSGLRNRSGEQEIESLQDQLMMAENALNYDLDRWYNHRDGIYADDAKNGWTRAETDAGWKERLEDLPKLITKLKNELTNMEIEMNLTCRPERTASAFIKRFGNRWPFVEMLRMKTLEELIS